MATHIYTMCRACGHQERTGRGEGNEALFASGTCTKCGGTSVDLQMGSTVPSWWKEPKAPEELKYAGGHSQRTMHLHYCLMDAGIDCNERRHAQIVMRWFGTTYQKAVPNSLTDSWQFWNCENAPDPLPKYLTEITASPDAYVGHGLSQEDADSIKRYGQKSWWQFWK
ncbi:hypothetical protein D3C76_758550 [compost metagenome]